MVLSVVGVCLGLAVAQLFFQLGADKYVVNTTYVIIGFVWGLGAAFVFGLWCGLSAEVTDEEDV
jgi:phage shock protein PspC (stress-responsive transcriptional regulator)